MGLRSSAGYSISGTRQHIRRSSSCRRCHIRPESQTRDRWPPITASKEQCARSICSSMCSPRVATSRSRTIKAPATGRIALDQVSARSLRNSAWAETLDHSRSNAGSPPRRRRDSQLLLPRRPRKSPGPGGLPRLQYGVLGLTSSAALVCAPRGIRINAICPPSPPRSAQNVGAPGLITSRTAAPTMPTALLCRPGFDSSAG
jgi:hypothetical protein